MTPRQNKDKLMDIGKSVADLAREIQAENPHVTENSMYTMINNMMWGRAYYPKYAAILNRRYGFNFKPMPARQQLRSAA